MEPAPSSPVAKTLHVVSRAFTLIEMLVVLAIITVITTIALIGQGTFNQSVFLTDTAYSVALSIREMQSLGLSSRKFDEIQNPGYGVHFAASTPTSYVLFADISDAAGVPDNCPVGTAGTPDAKPGNCLYDFTNQNDSDGVVRTYTFERGFTVTRFCGEEGNTTYCSDSGTGGTRLTDLDIAFLRSDTETIINGKLAAGGWISLSSAAIYIEWPETEDGRGICVSRIGQVSVTRTECP